MKYRIEHTTEELNRVINQLHLEVSMDFNAFIGKTDGAIHVLYKGEEFLTGPQYNKIKLALLDEPCEVFLNDHEVTVYYNRVQNLLWLSEEHSHYIINSDSEEEALRELFALPDASLDKLSQVYNYITGKEVIDHRDTSEYSNVNAQADVDFYAEEPIVEQSFKQTIL